MKMFIFNITQFTSFFNTNKKFVRFIYANKTKTFFFIAIYLICITLNIRAQSTNSKIDSLLFKLNTSKADTAKVNILNNLFLEYELSNEKKANEYLNKAFELAKKIDYKKGIADAYVNYGYLDEDNGNFNDALKNYFLSISIREVIKDDKGLSKAYKLIGDVYLNQGKYSDALKNYYESLKIREQTKDSAGIEILYNKIGFVYENECNYPEALKNYNLALKIKKTIGDKKSIATSYVQIGSVYYSEGNYPEALKNYFTALKIVEAIGYKKGIISALIGIGNIYYSQSNYTEALKNYFASLEIEKTLGNKKEIATTYNNIGLVYYSQGKYSESLKNHFISLAIREEIGDNLDISASYNNIGSVYYFQGNYTDALKYYLASLKIREEIGDKADIAGSYNNIGEIYKRLKNYKKAEEFLIKAKELSKEIGYKEYLRETYSGLSNLDSAKGDFKSAYENHKLFIIYRDSIDNEETRKKTIQSQMTYEFEKKEAVAKAEHKKELENQQALSEEKNRKQTLIIVFVVIGLLLVIVFAGFILHSLKVTKRQKDIIERQKQDVEEKNLKLNQQNEEIRSQRDEIEAQRDEIETQRDLVTIQKEHIEEIHKEVTDSINYAERIQRSFLATKELLDENLNEHFVFFHPKDVVSGDFYWAGKLQNGNFALATADSTGHGVPGAIMSILNISSLEKAIESGICEPSEILNHTRKTIIERLKKDGSPDGGKDGMDASLISFDFANQNLIYSAANNPIWVVRSSKNLTGFQNLSGLGEGVTQSSGLFTDEQDVRVTGDASANQKRQTSNFKLLELSPDKMPIGKHDKDQISFTQHEFQLQNGDVIYTLTDGFADQFGGTKGKKFMSKKLKELLIANCQLPMMEQKEMLEKTLVDWIGDGEQIDDITIIGIRI